MLLRNWRNTTRGWQRTNTVHQHQHGIIGSLNDDKVVVVICRCNWSGMLVSNINYGTITTQDSHIVPPWLEGLQWYHYRLGYHVLGPSSSLGHFPSLVPSMADDQSLWVLQTFEALLAFQTFWTSRPFKSIRLCPAHRVCRSAKHCLHYRQHYLHSGVWNRRWDGM